MAVTVNAGATAEALAAALKTAVDAAEVYMAAVFALDDASTAMDCSSAETITDTLRAALAPLVVGEFAHPYA